MTTPLIDFLIFVVILLAVVAVGFVLSLLPSWVGWLMAWLLLCWIVNYIER